MISRRFFLAGASALALAGCGGSKAPAAARGEFPFRLSDEQWRQRLSPAAYEVLRGHGTERPYSSPLNGELRGGQFNCAGCDHALFASTTKFDSRTGWPSFWQPLPQAIGTSEDNGLMTTRTEVHCANCGGHLGHVFDDGPPPTGLRYCMNGVAMTFRSA